LAARIGAAGWHRVEWRNLSGGIVALHRATA
jgi:demethylmenaquinone methyltransferase / 2-methoxy-6-polyprenyl-1,4-benzoquinol methylase